MRVYADIRRIELSRTNLGALLAKLDGHPPNSTCTLVKADEHTGQEWEVVAVEDSVHYSEYPRGPLHPATEAALNG